MKRRKLAHIRIYNWNNEAVIDFYWGLYSYINRDAIYRGYYCQLRMIILIIADF